MADRLNFYQAFNPNPEDDPMARRSAMFVKNLMDKTMGWLMFLAASPLFALIILLIRLEGLWDGEAKGPPFLKETRISKGRPFVLYKFRTLKQKVAQRIQPGDSATFLQARRENTTAMGRILVQCYLDELPQIYNIVKGDMSVVGPRPRIPEIYRENLADGFTALRDLKGGLTGLAQVNKRPGLDGVSLGEDYARKIRDASALELAAYDLGLMVKTVGKLLKAEGL